MNHRVSRAMEALLGLEGEDLDLFWREMERRGFKIRAVCPGCYRITEIMRREAQMQIDAEILRILESASLEVKT